MVSLKGKVIKHDRNMDIMFHVMTVSYKPRGMELFGLWLNMGYTDKAGLNYIVPFNGQNKPPFTTFLLERENLKDWKYAADTNVPCLRYGKWLSL